MTASSSSSDLDRLAAEIRRCRVCVERPDGRPLPHEPRPVLRVSGTARLLIASQAPGLRVHKSGLPFDDASGDRLRAWLGMDRETFYDTRRVCIAPMGFCFPGYDASGGDLPPRRECSAHWHDRLFALLPQVEAVLAIGGYAHRYHFARLGRPLPKATKVDDIVRRWREFEKATPRLFPLPHPSWRNTGWLKRNPWFESELLPDLRTVVRSAISD
ncbi:MAG: uracil-DNA glycosylase family protein [Rhodoblastus sp.]